MNIKKKEDVHKTVKMSKKKEYLILIIGAIVMVPIVWGLSVYSGEKIMNHMCEDNPEECVCEESINNAYNKCIEQDIWEKENGFNYRTDCEQYCDNWRYKTEEEKYCEENPDDGEKCECLEEIPKCIETHYIGNFTNIEKGFKVPFDCRELNCGFGAYTGLETNCLGFELKWFVAGFIVEDYNITNEESYFISECIKAIPSTGNV